MHRFLLAAVAAAVTPPPRQRQDIGKLPALGYNTWNDVRCDGVDAATILSLAQGLVQSNFSRKATPF